MDASPLQHKFTQILSAPFLAIFRLHSYIRQKNASMNTKKIAYTTQETYLYLDQRRKQLSALRKKMINLGLKPMEHAVFSTLAQQGI